MTDELSGPSGLEAGEKVPNEVRILASGENLGELRSVHRPATLLARYALKSARVYRFDNGLVLANGRGALGLYRYDQIVVQQHNKEWLVQRADGVQVRLSRHWSDIQALGEAARAAVERVAKAAEAEKPGRSGKAGKASAAAGRKAADQGGSGSGAASDGAGADGSARD
jgi:hypothetical protein